MCVCVFLSFCTPSFPPSTLTGLTYHDIVAEGPILHKAVSRLPGDMKDRRIARQKRGLDLSLKHAEVPKDKQADPWAEFKTVQELLGETQYLEDERAHYSDKVWLTAGTRDKWFEYDNREAWFHK